MYKTTDGGETWKLILHTNDTSGVGDMVMDPSNPNKLIAAMWEYGRKPWEVEYEDQNLKKREAEAFKAFIGEYARKFGPERRGITGEWPNSYYKDSFEMHKSNISTPKYRK